MNIKQKLIAIILISIFIVLTTYLIARYNNVEIIRTPEEKQNPYIIDPIPSGVERYKIINITYTEDQVIAIVHLDNGNIKIISLEEAYIDPKLKNVLDGYLYRDNGQIYIKAE